MIRLANPYFLLVGVVFLPLLFQRKATFLGYSQINLLEGERSSGLWHYVPKLLLALAGLSMIFGFARPQWQSAIEHERFLARDILLVMDLSYSMENGFERTDGPRKIDVAKSAAAEFVEKRGNDRIGLLVFGDETFGSWPLTRDHGLILKKVDRLGSHFYGGTNLAKPFVKAMDHFTEMGQSENRILVYLSDGQAKIRSDRKETIIGSLQKIGAHVYLVGVQVRKNDSDILEIVKRAGGRFIHVQSSRELTEAFEEIDRLEPSVVEVEVQGERRELYPICVLFALCSVLGLTVLQNTLFIELC